jgi:hypothetical protein
MFYVEKIGEGEMELALALAIGASPLPPRCDKQACNIVPLIYWRA